MTDQWEVVVGALSSGADKARERGRQWRLAADRCYSDFETMAQAEMARSDGVDAVMITTPNHVHFATAQAFFTPGSMCSATSL